MHLNFVRKLVSAVATAALIVLIVIATLNAPDIRAQDVADWQAAAGGKMTFDVASVKLAKGDATPTPPSFPLNAGEAYSSTGGYFRASFPLLVYIEFAYKILPIAVEEREMLAHAPRWIKTDSYRIEARAANNPTKDQMRLMMQSLLADRFQLRAHYETKEMPELALRLVKPGKLGPKLILHADGPPCGNSLNSSSATSRSRQVRGNDSAVFPPFCDSVDLRMESNGVLMLGYRNVTMDLLAGSLSGAVGQGYPVINKTSLSGRYDFTLEWSPALTTPVPFDSPASPGPTSREALRDQLGLRVEPMKGPVRILIVDHVERPSPN